MVIENKRSTVHPIEVTSSFSSFSSTTTMQAKTNRRRSIFAKLVKRSSVEPTFVPARSDQPFSALFSPTRLAHSMDEDFLRHHKKFNTDNNTYNGNDHDNENDLDFDDSEFRPPASVLEHIKREREHIAAVRRRRHSSSADSQRLQAERMFEKMEKLRAFDDLIQSGKTQTIKLSLTPELAV